MNNGSKITLQNNKELFLLVKRTQIEVFDWESLQY